MGLEAALDTLDRSFDILLTDPGNLATRLREATNKLESLTAHPEYDTLPSTFRTQYEKLMEKLRQQSGFDDTQRARYAREIFALYRLAINESD